MLRGVNAAVVGLLLAGLYHPVWTAGILMAGDYALAIAAFLLLFMWQTPPWLVVVLCALVVPRNDKGTTGERHSVIARC
jgi:chromate transporter